MFTVRVGRVVKLAVLVALASAAPAVRAATDTATGKADTATGKADTAKDKMPSSGAKMMQMDPSKVFQMMDPDQKGYVTKEEFMKFEEKLFDKWDKDRNGRLSMPEFTDRG